MSAALLAVASASRAYLVTTLGDRVIADLRTEVFAHIARLSASFFDTAKSGELISRLTADTTQIKSAVGSSISTALRNFMLFVGASAMMVVTSPRLSLFVLGAIPIIVLPLVGIRPFGSPPLAPRAGRAGQCLGLCGGIDRLGAVAAGLHQRRHGHRGALATPASSPTAPRAARCAPGRFSSPSRSSWCSAASSLCCGSARRM